MQTISLEKVRSQYCEVN